MHYNRVEVIKPIEVLVIGTGIRQRVNIGEHQLAVETVNDREYHLLRDSRFGMVTVGWESQQRAGAVRLFADRESQSAPKWNGVTLPITSSRQITPEHMKQPIAYFVRGSLLCTVCVGDGATQTYPDSIPVTPSNILPYSQDCHRCGQLLTLLQRDRRGPEILYKRFITFKEYKKQAK